MNSLMMATRMLERQKAKVGGPGPAWRTIHLLLLVFCLPPFAPRPVATSQTREKAGVNAGPITYGLRPAATPVKLITDAAGESASNGEVVQAPLPGEKAGQGVRPAPSAPQKSEEAKQVKSPAEVAASYFTNTVLLTQDNKPVRFFDDLLKGKTVVINFMFTTCTGVCPAMTANLLKVQDYLGERVGKDINMISISVDPVVDTPGALKTYAAKFKVKPGWFFLTGDRENVNLILRKLGGYVEDKNAHISQLYIGNPGTGEWVKAFAMGRPAELADAVLKVAGKN